jgi:CHRD domain
MTRVSAVLALTLLGLGARPGAAVAESDLSASLSGFHEVHFVAGPPAALRGAISTPAHGSFRATLDEHAGVIQYELSYHDLAGAVTQSHIHFGQRHTVGGIVVWLCQTAAVPAPAAVAAVTPMCPASGTVTGTISAGQVLDQAAQGFPAGGFDELVRAIRHDAAYANVHSTLFTPGEIRGPIRHGQGRHDD